MTSPRHIPIMALAIAITQYNKRSICNGKLIPAFDMENIITADNDTLRPDATVVSDIAEIVLMTLDSLVQRIRGGLKEFYRKWLC